MIDQGMRRQAPTAGRLAAAMATISAKRRPILDWVERNSEFKRAITSFLAPSPKPLARKSKALD
jgi:hypothetical protein